MRTKEKKNNIQRSMYNNYKINIFFLALYCLLNTYCLIYQLIDNQLAFKNKHLEISV